MSEKAKREAEEVSEILAVVSEKVPALIKGLISSVFSEEAARNMGKAAAAYYKELKAGGIPDNVAIKMTEDYMGLFTKISEAFKGFPKGHESKEIGGKVRKAVLKEVKEKLEKEGED